MADLFSLQGTYSSAPPPATSSGDPSVTAPIDERMMLGNQLTSQLTLTSGTPVALPFGALTGAHAVVVRAVGGGVTLTITYADASSQLVPVDAFFALISRSRPITAITVTRLTTDPTVVNFFLGQKAG